MTVDKLDRSYLDKLHIELIEILDAVVEVCEKNHLQYFLAYGTCLGAIRHEGFIPWDDDVDIAMPRKDYDRFVRICKTELPDGFYYQGIENEEKYWLLFGKVRKRDTVFVEESIGAGVLGECKLGIYIDVFPYDAITGFGWKSKLTEWVINKLKVVLFLKAENELNNHSNKLKQYISRLIPSKLIVRLYFYLIKKISVENPHKYVSFSAPYSIECGCISVDGTGIALSRKRFGMKQYNVPEQYDEYLRSLYGNYMELPPIEKRKTHKPVKIDFGGRK